MESSKTSLVVRYAETDAQGVVHHSNYLVWFEEGRSDFLRQRGLNYGDLEKSGYFVVVVEAQTRYRAPAFFEDEIEVETVLERARGRLLEFTYRVCSGGRLLAEGRTLHMILGRDRQPTVLPAEILERMVTQ